MRRAGHDVRLWARDAETVAAIERGENPRYLPGIRIDAGIDATTDIAEALDGADCVLAVTPAQALRDVLETVGRDMPPGVPLVLCAKGIERETGMLLSADRRRNPARTIRSPRCPARASPPTWRGPADRRGRRRARRGAGGSACAALLDRTLPLLFDRRPDRRRDRRRAEERLRHRRRRRHRRRARRQRAGRHGDARLRRTAAHRRRPSAPSPRR